MNLDFFYTLSENEADTFLKAFLENEKRGIGLIKDELKKVDINVDFELNNAAKLLFWIYGNVKTTPKKVDVLLPSWIINTDSYSDGLFSFEEHSKVLILRAAFYLGECFVLSNKKLTWSVGSDDSAVKNMPVVAGFNNSMELAPIMVLENIFSRMIIKNGTLENIQSLINTWKNYAK